jgi:DNA-directed RNA polymerase subunit RPC12/RpoP
VSVGEDGLRLANLRLRMIEQGSAGFVCARCYRATDVATLLDRSACPRCGGRIFVRLAGEGPVRRVLLAE